MPEKIICCFDTSVLIYLKAYPRRFFAGLWTSMEQLIADGRLIAPDEVLKELEGAAHEPARWAKANSAMFLPITQEMVGYVREIERDFPRLIDDRKEHADADALVVALAREVESRPPRLFETEHCVVVTLERPGQGQKIPDACAHYGIECIDWFGFLEAERISFP